MMEAGELLGMSERQFRRYRDRYEEDGLAAHWRFGPQAHTRRPHGHYERRIRDRAVYGAHMTRLDEVARSDEAMLIAKITYWNLIRSFTRSKTQHA